MFALPIRKEMTNKRLENGDFRSHSGGISPNKIDFSKFAFVTVLRTEMKLGIHFCRFSDYKMPYNRISIFRTLDFPNFWWRNGFFPSSTHGTHQCFFEGFRIMREISDRN